MKGFYEGVLGIYKEYDGLRIEPAIPENWEEVHAVRILRGCKYNLHYKKSANKEFYIEVNGSKIENNILPSGPLNEIFEVNIFY